MQPFEHVKPFLVCQRRHQGTCSGVSGAVHPVHVRCVLGLFVLIAAGESEQQPVGKRLVYHAHLEHGSLVVVPGVEASHLEVAVDHAVVCEVRVVVDVHLVVVVRIVLVSVQRNVETVFGRILGVDVGLVSVERAKRVRRVDPGAPAFVCHDVDGPAQGVASELNGHNALVHLDALGQPRRYVVEPEGRAHAFHRNPVDEHLYVAARESVERHVGIGAHSAALPYPHAAYAVHHACQVHGGVLKLVCLYK